ncbi:MAG: septation protein A [Betaproteobacteria bacterium]|nr:septation protein A [Betaproteobacteria bacterium]
MKFLFDVFPVLLFFIAYKFADIYTATGVAIAATFLQIGWAWFVRKKVEPLMWFTFAIIMIFGGLTLILHNPIFIKWKPTAIYWSMAAAMAIARWGFGRNAAESVMGQQIKLPQPIWARLNYSWMGFFTFMGALNLFVALNFSESAWVNFKLFGGTGLMLIFVVIQSLMLSRHIGKEDE